MADNDMNDCAEIVETVDAVAPEVKNDSDPLRIRLNEVVRSTLDLDRHKLIYCGEKPFASSLCNYSVRQKNQLVRHLESHPGSDNTSDDSLKIQSNEATSQSSDVSSHSQLNKVRHTSSHPMRLMICEVFSLIDGLPPSVHLGKILSDNVAGPDHHDKLNGDKDEPLEEPLHSENSEEHNEDSGFSKISEAHITKTSKKGLSCDKADRKSTLKVRLRNRTGEKRFKCGSCDYQAGRKEHLARHMKTHMKKRFTCGVCGFKTHEKSHLQIHAETHPKKRLFACEICYRRFTHRKSLVAHEKRSHGMRYECNNCEYKTKYKWHLSVHKSTHAKNKQITCAMCAYRTTTKTFLRRHVMVCHFGQYPYICDVCDYKTWHTRSFGSHMNSHNFPFACNICDFRGKEERELTSHIERYHSGGKRFACSICHYKDDNQTLLSKHIRSAHAAKEYLCYLCNYKTRIIEDVKQHILTTHQDESAVCVTTATPTNEVHEITSDLDDVKEYFCYACDYKASTVSLVEKHILNTHTTTLVPGTAALPIDLTSETPGNSHAAVPSNIGFDKYYCYACDYNASKIAHVEQHILSNHNLPTPGAPPSPTDVTEGAITSSLGSDVSDFRTAIKSTLDMHKMTHTGEKLLRCDLCSFKTRYRSNLAKHMMIHTGEKIFTRDLCDITITTKENLTQHIMTYTGEKPLRWGPSVV